MILRWLLPLGFLGLLAIAALLVIELLKPQYKEKRISGTTIWKRVVLHSKKQRLILSNVFIFLVQALVLALIAIGLAQPRLYTNKPLLSSNEYVIILDGSASMKAKSLSSGTTRFERAITAAKKEVDNFFEQTENGVISVIFAANTPSYIISNLKQSNKNKIFSTLDSLDCTCDKADLEQAITLAGQRFESNPYAQIFLYTDTQFSNLGNAVNIVNVSDSPNEINVALLGCEVGKESNNFVFKLTIGCYGEITQKSNISFDIKGASNGKEKQNFHLDVPVTFATDESLQQVQEILITATDERFGGNEGWIFDSFDEVKISISDLEDSISDDNHYLVYGTRDPIKVEYQSSNPNVFWQYGFNNLAVNMSSKRDISFRRVYKNQDMKFEKGYDFYIFENSIPDEVLQGGLPDDGVVLLVDPGDFLSKTNLGLFANKTISFGGQVSCTGVESPLLQYINPAEIHLTQYSQLSVKNDSGFEPLLFVGDSPVLLMKDTPKEKVIVMPFSINMSDFYGEQFQIFLYNLINYFSPITLPKFDFEIGEKVQFNCKGEEINVAHQGDNKTFNNFPAEFVFDDVGIYTFTTSFALNKEDEVRNVFVHMPFSESKLSAQSDFRITLDNKELAKQDGRDFFIWLAIASLVLMVIEWYLQFKYIL